MPKVRIEDLTVRKREHKKVEKKKTREMMKEQTKRKRTR